MNESLERGKTEKERGERTLRIERERVEGEKENKRKKEAAKGM